MIPDRVRVLGKVFTIRYMTWTEADDTHGMMTMDNAAIRITSGLDADIERDALLHEVIHAVDESLKLKMTEEQVHALACGLFAVFKENPEFVTYLVRQGT